MATVDDAYMKNDVFHIVFCIVLMSIGIQGTLLPLFAKKLDMIDDEENVMKTFNDYSDETEVQFIKLSVQPDSNWDKRILKMVWDFLGMSASHSLGKWNLRFQTAYIILL